MRLKRMYHAVICGLAALLVLTLLVLTSLHFLINRSQALNETGIKLITLGSEMTRTNDYLVKLMRTFVVTFDPALLEEYDSFLTYENLDGKLDEMLEIGLTTREEAEAREIFSLLDELAAIEARAIDAYHRGDLDLAVETIRDGTYAATDFLLANKTAALIADITERVHIGAAQIQSKLDAIKLLTSTVVTFSILAFILLQFLQQHRVLAPVVEIESMMTAISKGEVGRRLTKKHEDEIGSLFDHVNRMADSIEAYREQSENALTILKNILDGIDASIYVTIPDTGEILFVNEHMRRHFRIQGDPVGQYCYKLLQKGRESRCDFCPCFVLDEKPDDVVVWETYNPVSKRSYQNTDRYIAWHGGVRAHLQHSMDITDIKHFAEEKLKAEREALTLKHEKEKAEASSRAKNDFLAKMSHEIRTPMNAVMGMSELILRKDLPHDVYENALLIKNASVNLLSIINDILDLSKLESGMMEIVESEYMFPSLINDVIGIVRIRLIDKPIHFCAIVAPELPATLIGDEIRVRQVLTNLLSNAVKYTAKGAISLKVFGKTEDDRVTLTFEISDTGVGVKEENLELLFGDFVQLDATKNKGIEGTGLGLAISRNLCRMMGGDISVKSVYGQGSTFTVTLPQRFNTYAPFAAVPQPSDKAVLLYETRPVYRASLHEALEGLGVPYTSVESVPALFENIERHPFIFLSSFLYGSVAPVLGSMPSPPKIVLLADVTESGVPRNVRLLSLPAHSLSVANVLNDVQEEYGKLAGTGGSFIAPEARVLIVDDVTANLKVAEGLLMPYEMQVTLCSGGREAVELVAKEEFDLVFMDHMMPEVDGLEAALQIRAMEGDYFQELPIVALTANAVSGVREMFLQNGMNDFLAKPIETAKLDAILERWIPKHKRSRSRAPETAEQESPFVTSLRSLPELSVDKALSVVGGSPQTYERIVRLSARLLPENIERLNRLLESDLFNYSIEVHGVKGVLNNLGAYALGMMAFELEELSRNGEADACRQLHPAFLLRISAFSDSMLSLTGEMAEKTPGDPQALQDALPELLEAADYCDNASALKLLGPLGARAYGAELDQALSDLTDLFERFEFDEAAEVLERLKEALAECKR